ncbi:hypothetical protein Naga_100581g1 [Nannochloropsis gaditana]|uniref:Uncharacterized protein n=1 Tax=Nannochloropsis gaditana TaxID=72520 RepID=W7TT59_9STRA|nr:hypothetical protein Naga_100581g1 [Nannochloropsis gaditana]
MRIVPLIKSHEQVGQGCGGRGGRRGARISHLSTHSLQGLNGISSASIAVEGTPRAVSGHKCLVLCAASVAAAWVPLPLGTYEESPRRRRRGRRSISIPWGGVWGHEPEEKRAAWTQGISKGKSRGSKLGRSVGRRSGRSAFHCGGQALRAALCGPETSPPPAQGRREGGGGGGGGTV